MAQLHLRLAGQYPRGMDFDYKVAFRPPRGRFGEMADAVLQQGLDRAKETMSAQFRAAFQESEDISLVCALLSRSPVFLQDEWIYGGPEQLPFDLRQRAIRVAFRLPPEASSDEKKPVLLDLCGRLQHEIDCVARSSVFYGLSSASRALISHLIVKAEYGFGSEPRVSGDTLRDLFELTEEELEEAVDDLEGDGYVGRTSTLGSDVESIWPTEGAFWTFDPYVMDWHPEHDARVLATALIKTGKNAAVADLAKELGWSPRRVNPAVT